MRDATHEPPKPGVDEFSPTAAPLAQASRMPGSKEAAGPFLPPGSAVHAAVTPVIGSVLGSLDSLDGKTGAPQTATTEAATGVPRRADETVDPLVGTVLADRYRIDRRLGAGGMGAVYAGFHITLNKRIALKVVQPRLGGDATIAQRFVQEARAASAIGHEHIVQITDFGHTADDAAFLVMEYLEGEDLSETLRREGPLPWSRVVHIGEQIAWALAAAHRQGIVHRDIKPANCYRVPREHDEDFIKVLDFGLAKVLAEQRDGESLTGTGMLLGTPGYIAPELYRGLKADHRVDIYALGALMHKLLTGELPPMASGSGAVDSMRNAHAPGAVMAILKGALAESPDERYGTAQELATALRAIPRVSMDEPTQLGQVDGARTQITTGSQLRGDPSSAQAITLREPTPSTFPSLFTVERDGHRVRFYFGAPLIALVVALVGGLVWYLTRPAPLLARLQDEFSARQLRALTGTTFAVAAEGTAPPPHVATPTPTTPTSPTTPPPGPPPVVPEPAAPGPVPAVAPEPDPKDMPPEPGTKPTRQRHKGSADNLGKCLTRKCGLETIAFTIELTWKTDETGDVIGKTVAAKDGNRDIIDCAVPRVRQCPLVWDPSKAYTEKITIGMRGAKKSP